MAKDTYVIEDDGFDELEAQVLSKMLGPEQAKKVLADSTETEFDPELQAIIDNAPALDET